MRQLTVLALLFAACTCSPEPAGPDTGSYVPTAATAQQDSGDDSVILGTRCDNAAIHDKIVRVLDGDTVEISSGEKIRLLLVDTPEIAHNSKEVAECYGDAAREFTATHLLESWVDLEYDVECRDRYGRLLAYIYADGLEAGAFNEVLLSEGYATVLYIPPNGKDLVSDYRDLAATAKNSAVGGYGVCANFNQ